MTINPYQILGVKKSATPEEIKSAYLKLAKTVHPDAGGGADEFIQIKQAYDILSDPNARAAFDRDGYVKGDDESEACRLAFNALCGFWNEMFQQIPADRLPYTNIITVLRESVSTLRTRYTREIKRISEKENHLKKSRETITKRLKKKKKTSQNLFLLVIDTQIEGVQAEKKKAELDKKVMSIALDILKEYEFSPDKEEMVKNSNCLFSRFVEFGAP